MKAAGFVEFKSGTGITFDATGLVTNGSLNKKTLWHNADGSHEGAGGQGIGAFTADGAEQG